MNPNAENSYGKSIFQVSVNVMPSISRCETEYLQEWGSQYQDRAANGEENE